MPGTKVARPSPVKLSTKIKISLRFVRYLLWEFRYSIAVFWGLVFAGGWVFHKFYHHNSMGYLQSCHAVFCLIFLEASIEFPDEWYLQVLFFLLPIIGLGAVADSFVRMAYLLFAQKRKLQEWQIMHASLLSNHVVVVGAGKLGSRILGGLLELRENVVLIEKDTNHPFLEEWIAKGIPVILGDARQRKTLELAGIRQARSLILGTDDDLCNLDAALTARDINPGLKVILRMFDDTLSEKFGLAFAMPTISMSRVAAPAYIAAATGRSVYHEFELAGQRVHLVDIRVSSQSLLSGKTVGEIQAGNHVNIVMHRGVGGVHVNPGHEITLKPGDEILVIAPLNYLVQLEHLNKEGGAGQLTQRH